MKKVTLYHFSISHYSEKVRWALDYKGIPYDSEMLLPGTHIPTCLLVSGQTKVPILQVEKDVWTESSEIIKNIDRKFPGPKLFSSEPTENARINSIVRYFDSVLGSNVRIVVYDALFRYSDNLGEFFACGFTGATAFLAKAIAPVLKIAIENAYQVNPESATASRKKLDEALGRIVNELNGQNYLVGNKFTAADLTVAALLYPLILPTQFPYPLPQPKGEGLHRFLSSYEDHEAIRYAKRIWAEHRNIH